MAGPLFPSVQPSDLMRLAPQERDRSLDRNLARVPQLPSSAQEPRQAFRAEAPCHPAAFLATLALSEKPFSYQRPHLDVVHSVKQKVAFLRYGAPWKTFHYKFHVKHDH